MFLLILCVALLTADFICGRTYLEQVTRKRSIGSFNLVGLQGDDDIDSPTSEFVLGKDRELFHFSVDLKWLVTALRDKRTYVDAMKKLLRSAKNLDGSIDRQTSFVENAADIMININEKKRARSNLNIFLGPLRTALKLCSQTNRFALYYIEPVMSPIVAGIHASLGDITVETTLNDKLIFFASHDDHPFVSGIERILSQAAARSEASNATLSLLSPCSLPMFVLLSPNRHETAPPPVHWWFLRPRLDWVVLGTWTPLVAKEATAARLLQWLRATLDENSHRILGNRSEHLSSNSSTAERPGAITQAKTFSKVR